MYASSKRKLADAELAFQDIFTTHGLENVNTLSTEDVTETKTTSSIYFSFLQ